MQRNYYSLPNQGKKIIIRQRSLMHWLVLIVSFWPFLMNLTSVLPNPLGYIKYLPDGVILILFLQNLNRRRLIFKRRTIFLVSIVVALFVYTLLVYLLRYQSIAYYLWGVRNNFRFYIAFFAFSSYLDQKDIATWFNTLDLLFWLNLLLAFYQFFVMGVRGDYIGGIFGIWGKTNGYTTVFLCIVMMRSFLKSFSKEERLVICIFKSICSLTIAALAELKACFVLFVLILIGSAILTSFSWKKCLVLLMGSILLMVGTSLLSKIYGFEGFFSWEYMWNLATQKNYSSQNDVNRLSAISTLSVELMTSPLDRIFGFGLGNCDTSSFAVFNTPFFKSHGSMHYTWLTAAMVFLEMGYIGLVAYMGFFAISGWKAYNMYRDGIGNRINNQQALLMSVICLILMFYNSSLRIESAYMIYFVLSLPLIKSASENKAQIRSRMCEN